MKVVEYEIVSYDSSKTWVDSINNKKIFCKKTSETEIENLKKLKLLINNRKITIKEKEYHILLPNVLNWDKNNHILYTDFCNGKNLECMLRNQETHENAVVILNSLLEFMINNNIFWVDFAPRNILITENIIYLVDYEKGIMDSKKIYEYLRNHVYEEYALFLFKNERLFDLEYIFKVRELEKDKIIPLNGIKCTRIKKIAEKMNFNYEITIEEYLKILEILIRVEEPKIINNNFYFPGVELDKIFKSNPFESALEIYVLKVLELYNNII